MRKALVLRILLFLALLLRYGLVNMDPNERNNDEEQQHVSTAGSAFRVNVFSITRIKARSVCPDEIVRRTSQERERDTRILTDDTNDPSIGRVCVWRRDGWRQATLTEFIWSSSPLRESNSLREGCTHLYGERLLHDSHCN